jgi:hypothetical protein
VCGLFEREVVLQRGHTNLAVREQCLADHHGQERSHHDRDGEESQQPAAPEATGLRS